MSTVKSANPPITTNRKARYDYTIEETFEAGIKLEGWEIKSLVAGRVNFSDSYAIQLKGEMFLIGTSIQPLSTAVSYEEHNNLRTRKLLLHKKEVNYLLGAVEKKGYTLIPLSMYWKHGKVKVELGLAKGKQNYDKRATIKEREWNIEKQRLNKNQNLD